MLFSHKINTTGKALFLCASGNRNAFTGIWVMGQKLGLALGAGIAGLGLHLFGFIESLAGTFTEQSDSAMFAIVLFVSVVPSIICLLSLYPIYKSKQSFNS